MSCRARGRARASSWICLLGQPEPLELGRRPWRTRLAAPRKAADRPRRFSRERAGDVLELRREDQVEDVLDVLLRRPVVGARLGRAAAAPHRARRTPRERHAVLDGEVVGDTSQPRSSARRVDGCADDAAARPHDRCDRDDQDRDDAADGGASGVATAQSLGVDGPSIERRRRGRAARAWWRRRAAPRRSRSSFSARARPAASTSSRLAPGTTVTPSTSPTTQSPVATSTSPTTTGSPTAPGCCFVAPGSASPVENTGNPCAASAATSRTHAVDHEPGEAARLGRGGEHLAPVAAARDRRRRRRRARVPAGAAGDADVDREVVAGRAPHRERGRREPRAGPHGSDARCASAVRPTRRASPRRGPRGQRAGGRRSMRSSARELAEGEGFEPSRRFNTPYSLSRRAPSATRSSLPRTWSSVRDASWLDWVRVRRRMDRCEALERIAELLAARAATRGRRSQAFRRAADAIRDVPSDELQRLADAGTLTDLPGIGTSTATVITQALAGETPEYLDEARRTTSSRRRSAPANCSRRAAGRPPPPLRLVRRRAHDRGDGAPRDRARPRVPRAHRPLAAAQDRPRARRPSGCASSSTWSRALNEELAPFRILTGIEVDILDDGTLDQEAELLARLDVVVGERALEAAHGAPRR